MAKWSFHSGGGAQLFYYTPLVYDDILITLLYEDADRVPSKTTAKTAFLSC